MRRSDAPKGTKQQHKALPPRKEERPSSVNVMRILYFTALALAVIAIVLIGVKTYQDLSSERNAEALMQAYKQMATVAPTASPETLSTPTPDAAATATATAEVSVTPAITATPEPDTSHRFEDNSEDVDEGADYVQPNAPSVTEAQQIIKKIVAAVGDEGVIGTIEIPSTEQEYPIIGKWSYNLLKISICRYQGPLPNQEGNIILIGHNYKSGAHFGNLDKLKVGDELFLSSAVDNKRVRYEVYETETVLPDKFSELDYYKGECGLTLMTCKSNGNYRLIVRCVQKDAAMPAPTASTTTS